MTKKQPKEKQGGNPKLKIGDYVWFRMPHNGRIEFIYKNGDVRIELDEISPKTIMSRFAPHEIEKVKRSKYL